MISRYHYKKEMDLPDNMICRISSELPINSVRDLNVAWCALTTLTADNPMSKVKSMSMDSSKTIKFLSQSKKYESLGFVVKLINTIFVIRENLETFEYSGKRKTPWDTITIQITDLPISVEFESFAVSTEKKPFGNLNIKLDLRLNEDRIYVVESFWRMLSLPVERR